MDLAKVGVEVRIKDWGQLHWYFFTRFCLNSIAVCQITNFFAHAMTAVLLWCAKFSGDYFINIWMTTKLIFHQMWIIITELSVKWTPGGRLNIKMSSYQYRDPHVKNKTVLSLIWEWKDSLYIEIEPSVSWLFNQDYLSFYDFWNNFVITRVNLLTKGLCLLGGRRGLCECWRVVPTSRVHCVLSHGWSLPLTQILLHTRSTGADEEVSDIHHNSHPEPMMTQLTGITIS